MAYLSQEEAAAYIRVPVIRLKNWRWIGQGPEHFRLSHKTVLYDSVKLDEWISSNSRKPSVQAFMEERDARS